MRQPLCIIEIQVLGLELAVRRLDLVAHVGERCIRPTAHIGHLDDVEAELGTYRITEFLFGQGEGRIFEGWDHQTTLDPTEVAATLRRAGVIRVGLCQAGEIGTATQLREQIIGLALSLGHFIVARTWCDRDQDMPHRTFFTGDKLRPMVAEILLQRLIVDVDQAAECGSIQQQVVDLYPLRRPVAILIALVITAQLFLGRDRLIDERRCGQPRITDSALLCTQSDTRTEIRLGNEHCLADTAAQLRKCEVLAHALLEVDTAHAAIAHRRLIGLLIKPAVALKCRHRDDEATRLRIAGTQIPIAGAVGQQPLFDHRVQYLRFQPGIIEKFSAVIVAQ